MSRALPNLKKVRLEITACGAAVETEDADAKTPALANDEQIGILSDSHESAGTAASLAGEGFSGTQHDLLQKVFRVGYAPGGHHFTQQEHLRLRWGKGRFLNAILSTPGRGHDGPRMLSVTLPGSGRAWSRPGYQRKLRSLHRQAEQLLAAMRSAR